MQKIQNTLCVSHVCCFRDLLVIATTFITFQYNRYYDVKNIKELFLKHGKEEKVQNSKRSNLFENL